MGTIINTFLPRRRAARFVELYIKKSPDIAEEWANKTLSEEEKEEIKPHLKRAFARHNYNYTE